jgi:hypothetical protein
MMIFLNGERVGQKGGAAPVPVVQNNFGIGKWAASFGWEDVFMGIIDDVKLWSRALTADEVRQASQPAPVEPGGKLAVIWGNVKSSL